VGIAETETQDGRTVTLRWVPRRSVAPLLVALALVAVTACGDDATAPGRCVHEYREPIIELVSAHDARFGSALSSVVLTNIRFNGHVLEPSFLASVQPAYGVTARGDSLVCAIPCGFATEAGNYIFTISAAGYPPPQDRGYEAQYGVFHGGCPSYSDEGLRIDLRLWQE